MKTPFVAARLLVAVSLLVLAARPASAQRPMTLTLGDAARYAATHGTGPEAARYRVDRAAATLRQQRADLLPNLAGSVSGGERTFNSASLGLALPDPATGNALFDPGGQAIGPVRTWDFRATVRQSLVDLPSRARVRAGQAAVVAADVAVEDAGRLAADQAATLYVRMAWAEALLSARQADSLLANELLCIARSRQEAGMATTLDVTRARVQLSAAAAQTIVARNDRERARLELQRALGLPFDTPVALADSLLGMPTTLSGPSETEAEDLAMRTRADVRLLEAQLDVAESQLAGLRAERLPTVSLFAEVGPTGSGVARLLNTYSWGLQVSVPLFDGHRREARAAEQESAIREQVVRQHDLVQQVALEVRVALLQLASAGEQIEAADERLALAEQELELARRRFTEGVDSNADVVAAMLGLNAARTQSVDARAAFQSARVGLARALGVVTELP